MNRSTFTALGLTLCVGVACSSNSDDRSPAVSDGGTSSQAGGGGRKPTAGSGGRPSSDGGSAGESAAGGSTDSSSGAGGEGGLEQGMIIPVTPSICSESATWNGPTPLAGVSTAANERLLSITPDELDILFLRDEVLMSAHRNAASAAFDAGAAVTLPDDFSAAAGVALSADGRTMVLLGVDGQTFASVTRNSRSGAFGTTADSSAFTAINQRAIQTMQHYAAPVLAPDGKSFVFSAFTPEPDDGFPSGFEGVSVVFESVWSATSWAMPESISQNLFDGTTGTRALPSGLSSDSRTLFYFDEGSGKQVARFRDRPDAPLYTAVDLGDRIGAVPVAKCNRIYYSSDDGDVLIGSN